jgi:enoyl-CoA hydratase/carnithine racemase
MSATSEERTQDILVDREGSIAWIRLNRPERRNAYDGPMAEAMIEAIRDAHDASVIAITGVQDSFCAGGFLKNLAGANEGDIRRMFYGSLRLFDEIRRSPRPVIAAVNGPAMGGGNELVVACDFAIAVESAYFGQTGPRIGSAPVLGGTNMLALSVGEKRAKEVSMLCRRYTARQACELGWINEVVPDDGLEEAVHRRTAEIEALSPRYLEIAKISSNVWWNAVQESYLSGLGMLVQAVGSEDMLEGAAAFMEKRRPDFRNARRR